MTWHLCVISDVRTPSGKVPPRRRAVQHDELMMTFIELGEQEPGLVDLVSVLHDIAAWRGRRCSRPRTSSPPPSACAPPIMIRCDNSTCAAPGDNGDDERNGRSRRSGGGGNTRSGLQPPVGATGSGRWCSAFSPSFGLYAAQQVQKGAPREGQTPERGVVEVKP